MKTICFFAAFAAALCAQAQDTHQWKAAFTVVDDSGSPLRGANVSVFYDVAPRDTPTDSGKIIGVTDAGGEFAASHTDKTFRLRFLVQKAGYYSTDIKDDFHGLFTPEHLNRDLTIVLKKIANPIPMYAKWIDTSPLKGDGNAGLDLTSGHWIASYGGGDIFFTSKSDRRSPSDFDYILTISFPNPGDGIQEYIPSESEKGSQLRSPHEAPADGYQSQLTRTNSARPTGSGNADYDENRVYFFRVHTVLDQAGNVKSALYGKIYGDPIFLNFYYYLNPTPNDRNIEFDTKQNLIKKFNSEAENVKNP
jgi:hypothetical protein